LKEAQKKAQDVIDKYQIRQVVEEAKSEGMPSNTSEHEGLGNNEI
jgi:hypothetical protein